MVSLTKNLALLTCSKHLQIGQNLMTMQGLSTDIVFLDFKKAFDGVPHQRLLIKLRGYGITNNCLKWISSFLSSRHQRVVASKR